MKKFEGIIFCTDLDGTLLREDKSISAENLDAIEYFKKEGGKFTFITGRMPFSAYDICEIIKPNCPFGCINGGGIYDYNLREYAWKKPIPGTAKILLEEASKNLPETGIQVNTFEKTYFCKENSATDWFRTVVKIPYYSCKYDEINEEIAKIVFCDNSDENILALEKLLRSHPLADEFYFIRSEKRLFEILPKNNDKGTLITKLAEHLGYNIDKTIAIGDYNNDVPMLEAAGLGIAVSNASDALKAVADYITVSNEEHAIANIIDMLDKGKLLI